MAKDNIYIMGKSKKKRETITEWPCQKTTRKTSTYTYLFFSMWGFGNKNKQYSDDLTLIIDILTKSRRSCKHINRNSLIQKILYTTIWFWEGGGGYCTLSNEVVLTSSFPISWFIQRWWISNFYMKIKW